MPSPSLRERQQLVFQAITAKRSPATFDGFADDTLGATEQLAIYRAAYQAGCTQALEHVYPVCNQLVGERCFRSLAHSYFYQHPMRSNDLNAFGGHFAEHIARLPPARELPYLTDMARFEWALHRAKSGHESPVLSLNDLPTLTDSSLLKVAPSLRLIQTDFDLKALWTFHQEQQHDPLVLSRQPRCFAIWRCDFSVRILGLNAVWQEWLAVLQESTPLSSLLAQIHQRHPEAELATMLTDSLAQQWLVEQPGS